MRKNFLLACVIAGISMACGNSPTAPSQTYAPPPPTTGVLHVGLDVSTCYAVLGAVVSVDGTIVGKVYPGDAGVSQTVSIGQHSVSAVGVGPYPIIETWRPQTVTVPAAGYNYLLFCTGSHGYSIGKAQ